MLALKIIRNYHVNRHRICLRLFQSYANNEDLNKDLMKSSATSDSILQSIKSSTNAMDLLNVLAKREKRLDSQEVMQSLKSIFILQHSGTSSISKEEIIKRPEFEELLHDLRRASRSLDLNDIIDALKVLSFIGVSTNTNITYILLNLLRKNINDVTLNQVIFLSFLLKKFERTPLVEAIQIALPIIFQLQLSTQIDHENVPQLIDFLLFASRNKVSTKCVMSIVSALTLHGTNLEREQAKSILWSLRDLYPFKGEYEKLVKNCFNVLNKNYKYLSFENIESTLTRVTEKYQSGCDAFYNEEFYNKCASYVIEVDLGFENATYILRKFNKVGFVNIFLLDYLAGKITDCPSLLEDAKLNIYSIFLLGFSTANYIPKQWDSIKPMLINHSVLKSDRIDLPWLKMANDLIVLDCFNYSLFEKLLSDEFLVKHLAKEDEKSMKQLHLFALSLYQNVVTLLPDYKGNLPSSSIIQKAVEIHLEKTNFPLKNVLEFIFGDSRRIYTKIATKLGHLIDHIIVYDENFEPIDINCEQGENIPYVEQFRKDNQRIIAILTFPGTSYALNIPRLKGPYTLRIKSLEAMGISVIPINLQQWVEMPEKEKLPYLQQEIKYKLQNVQK